MAYPFLLVLSNSADGGVLADQLRARDWDVELSGDKLGPEKAAKPSQLIVSYGYRHIVDRATIAAVSGEIVNLHISLLPWNRGADPNIWSFLEDTPKGVTIHRLTPGLDRGPIFAQRRVEFDEAEETLASSYEKLQNVVREVFLDNVSAIAQGRIAPWPQEEGGSSHRSAELASYRDALLGHEGFDVPIPTLRRRWRDFSAAAR
ncbi:methionyl-tRNA formyltransferase [Tranquillimonas rosea]|uniref:Methionyl-tRNA formyltransferase n=1 Tax=Tranquillimonas rosea TaxID=641238 RepID=A0A1H9UY50_9RHOB|nr:formyltransferase family protein [Tranquillimonas rosea]SES14366.1 methionyl-tRNA formyltransferase [Tranquillimonas rosea]